MGWDIEITTDKSVSETLMDEIISELPPRLQGWGGKQKWGWSLACDINFHIESKIGGFVSAIRFV